MGRSVKLTDQKKAWFLRDSRKKRRLDTRPERQRFLIVCEGTKTEPNYFAAIKKELPQRLVELEISGQGANTMSLVARAQEIRDGWGRRGYLFDQVWVVLDRDSFQPDDFDNAIKKAKADNIQCAWSNEAFELWFILHFEFRNTAMDRARYQERLSTHLGIPYRKNAEDMYENLQKSGGQEQAVAWARKLHEDSRASGTPPSRANPCTTVYQLIQELSPFMPTTRESAEGE